MDHKDICFEIENDEFYHQFLANTNKQYFNERLSGSEKIEKLNKGIEKLNSELESQVLSKHQDLLTQASHATNLEKVIGSMQLEARGLLTGIEKLRSQILLPYNMLDNQTTVLNRIQKVCHLMRQALKVLELYKGLEKFDKNPSLQANLVYEIELIIKGCDFEGIDLLVEEIQVVNKLKIKIISDASIQLYDGLSNGDKTVLFSSFNIFNNLHCVKEKINDIITAELNTLTQHIHSVCNVQQYGDQKRTGESTRNGPGKANVVNTINAKQFWDNIEKMFNETLYSSCKKIILLQNSLNDLHSFENFCYVAKGFWDNLSTIFATELKKSSYAINQIVETEFPRLLECYNELCKKLHFKQFNVKRDTLTVWENSFLSKSLAKLLDPVRNMWQFNHTPSLEQVDEAVRAISAALSVSLGDKQLSVALALSVSKCIKQMSTEAEQRVCVDSDAGQVIEAPTSSQQKNADLSNILYYFSKQINRVLSNMLMILSAESINIIQESLKDVSCVSVLTPFCISINSAVSLILGSMHGEIGNTRTESSKNMTCSLYMKELQHFMARCKDTYLSMFEDPLAVKKCCEDVVKHCVNIFIYNVCSLGQISDHWRKKIQFDCSQLAAILTKFESLGNHPTQFRELRALYNSLQSTPAKILEKQLKSHPLPHSLTMMILFLFAGPDLLPPHQCAGWTHEKLVSWLTEHQSERERIEFVAGALQRYSQYVNQKNITKYDDVYPILIQLLEDARKN